MIQAFTRTLLASIFIVFGSGVLAEESGEIIVKMGDETAHFLLDMNESDWGGGDVSLSTTIWGRAADEFTRERFVYLTIGFEILGNDGEASEARLAIRGREKVEYLFAKKDDTHFLVTIDEIAISGEQLTISGTFMGDMGTSIDRGRTIDLSDPLNVSGSFKAVLDK